MGPYMRYYFSRKDVLRNSDLTPVQITRKIGDEWKAMSPKEREPFQNAAKNNPAPEVKPEKEKKKAASKAKTKAKKGAAKKKLNFDKGIRKTLKLVYPGLWISKEAMAVMDSFVRDMLKRLSAGAAQFVEFGRKRSLQTCDIQGAVKIILQGELAKHAVSEGSKACTKCFGSIDAAEN